MTESLGGIGYSSDAVAAKLSLDLPHDSQEVLKEISRYTSEIRGNMEATSRFTNDYISYLQSYPVIARQVNDLQREQLQLLRDTANAMHDINSARSSSQGFVQAGGGFTGGAIGGAFGGYAGGYGGGYGGASFGSPYGYRPPLTPYNNHIPQNLNEARHNEMSRQSRISERVRAREQEETHHARRQHEEENNNTLNDTGRHHLSGGRHRSEVEENAQPGYQSRRLGGSLERMIRDSSQHSANSVLDAASILAPGGSNASRLAALSRLIGQAPGEAGEAGSGLAGMLGRMPTWAKGAGIAGAGIAAGGLAFNAIQDAGEGVQGLRNQDMRGHSLAGGAEVEKDIRLMALNPLISNEQSRSIIMSAMGTGKQGQAYESAVDFIKGNLIDMNISVSDSVALLRSNVDLGNQSIAALKLSLGNAQGLAQVGSKTTESSLKDFTFASTKFTGKGMTGAKASQQALLADALFATPGKDGKVNPLAIAPTGPDGKPTDSSPMAKAITALTDSNLMVAQVLPNHPNWNATNIFFCPELDWVTEATAVLKKWANNAYDPQANDKGYKQFRAFLVQAGAQQIWGEQFDQIAGEFFNQLNNPGNADPIQQAKDLLNKNNQTLIGGLDPNNPNPSFEDWKKGVQSGQFKDLLGATSEEQQMQYKSWVAKGSPMGGKVTGGAGGDSKGVVQKIIDANPDAVLVDPSGKAVKPDGQSAEQNAGLANPNSGWKVIANPGLAYLGDHQDSWLSSINPLTALTNDVANRTGQSYDAAIAGLDPRSKNQQTAADLGLGTADSSPDGVNNAPIDPTSPEYDYNTGTTTPSGLRSGGGGFSVPGAPSVNQPTQTIELGAWARNFFEMTGIVPGTVDQSPQADAANSATGGSAKNTNPPRPRLGHK